MTRSSPAWLRGVWCQGVASGLEEYLWSWRSRPSCLVCAIRFSLRDCKQTRYLFFSFFLRGGGRGGGVHSVVTLRHFEMDSRSCLSFRSASIL